MKVVFYASDKPREIMLAKALQEGVKVHGDELEIRRTAEYGEDEHGNDLRYPGPDPSTDVACMFGVKGKSKVIMQDHRAMERATLYFDKGFSRQRGEGGHTEYSRVCVNSSHPLDYMMREPRSQDRLTALGIELITRKVSAASQGHVLYCGSSQKYHDFYNLGDATEYAIKIFKRLRGYTSRHFVYRPKPSWKGAVHIPGSSFSSGTSTIVDAMTGCHCLVTHGSSAAWDAIIAGIPVITLGASIAQPVANLELTSVEHLKFPTYSERIEWLRAVAYCQWTTAELRSGKAWQYVKEEIVRQIPKKKDKSK